MSENTNKVSHTKYALAAFLASVIFVIMYKYNMNEILPEGYADIKDHIAYAQAFHVDTFWQAWLKLPYPVWHLCVQGSIVFLKMPVNEAACWVSGLFCVFGYFVTFFIIDKLATKLSGRDAGVMAAGISAILSLVMPLYVPWFNTWHYEGQFSINPFFNPTHMAVKPIGLLVFAYAIDLIRQYQGMDTIFCTSKRAQKLLFPMFSVMLLFSTFTKPTFMYMLLPAGVCYLLVDMVIALWRKDGSWKKVWSFMWRIGCAAIPAVLYLIFQYSAFYLWGGTNEDAKVAIYPLLTAWHLYSPNVPTSILISMLFPIWMGITNPTYFIKSVEGRLAAIGYAVGTMEFSLFVETGNKLGHLNFSWPMMAGMLLIWVICAAKLVELSCNAKPGKWTNIKIVVGWLFLGIHLFSGLYYINPYEYII